ncbi:hypothetical protein IKT18_03665 [Candidatus Saccharibacteria bacterium]|nr:hypothetical protein [Candidatus Saccharibacteria bacterium]
MSYIGSRTLRRRVRNATIGGVAVLLLVSTLIAKFLLQAYATQNYFGYTASTLTESSSAQVATVSIKAISNVTFYTFEGNFFAHEDDSSYFTLDSMTYSSNFAPADVLENTVDDKGGIFYWKNTTNGVTFNAGDTIWTATYIVSADAPVGVYNLPIVLDAVSFGPSSYIEDETIDAVVEIEGEHYTGTFAIDGHLTVTACSVQYDANGNCSGNSYTINNGDTLGIRNSSGIYDITGSGQLNLRIIPDTGYIVSNITATDNTYNAIKGPADINVPNGYRITKITNDTTVNISSRQANDYSATLHLSTGVTSVKVCSVQYVGTTCNGTETTLTDGDSIAAKTSSGVSSVDGNDQLNFIINVANGYKLDIQDLDDLSNIFSIGGVYNNLKTISANDNSYRITQIASDIDVTITATAQIAVTPSITPISNQTYNGSAINPEIEVTAVVDNEDIILKEEADYTYTISNNTNAGTAIIDISPVAMSDFTFTAFSAQFTILPYELSSDNISAPEYILAGNSLSASDITVTANNTTLTACADTNDTSCDYLLTITKASGTAGENATGSVEGRNGNYTGTVNFTVPIQAKPNQTLSFAESSVTVEWGSTVSNPLTHSVGDGTISYWTSDSSVASVSNNGTITLNGIGETTIFAQASETSNYAATTTSYTLTVNKKVLSIVNASVANKTYDATTNAQISSVSLSNINMVYGTDFTATAAFTSVNAGGNIPVTVTVTLNDTTHYVLDQATFTTSASITRLTLGSNNTTASLNNTEYTYSGSTNQPSATVVVNINGTDYNLVEGTDYSISYSSDTTNVGTKSAVIIGTGNYAGTLTALSYTVSPATVTDVTAIIPSQTYTGTVRTPNVSVTASFDGSTIALTSGTDYTLDYNTSAINAGSYPVTINPRSSGSNYTFTTTEATFVISSHELVASDVSLEYTAIHYTGYPLEPAVTVKINGRTISSDYYTVSYPSNTVDINSSLAVTVSGKNSPANLSGSVTKTYAIVDQDVLTISGVPNDQSITYTGSPVVLQGSPVVSGTNSVTGQPYNISGNDLTVTWYAADGVTEIDRPTNAGSYVVTYSYNDNNCTGQLSVNFTITKATSPQPEEMTADLSAEAGLPLSEIAGRRTPGFEWDEDTTTVIAGNHSYAATYTYNNDTTNYTTLNLQVPVRGLSRIDITVTVDGEGEYSTTDNLTDVLEGSTITLTLTPTLGYELSSVIVGSTDMTSSVVDNVLSFTAGDADTTVTISFAMEEYTIVMTDERTFKVNADYRLFEDGGKVHIDGKLVKSSNYTSWSGSTIIQFTEAYMESLSIGEHTIAVTLNHGAVVTTTFERAAIPVPDTGFFSQENTTAVAVILLPTTLIVAAVVFLILRKKNKSQDNEA